MTAQPSPSEPLGERIRSLDVFRGLTMLVMLFVNDINDAIFGNIKDSPWWLHHMPSHIDGMTLNDVIFPMFLFIVGLSIPVALERRMVRGDSLARLFGHIAQRALGMIFIGVCMVNMYDVNETATGMSGAVWRLLLLGGIILLWNRYPSFEDWKRWPPVVLRVAAVGLLIYLLVMFRQDINGETVWLRPRWWGIIGIIGWAYLVAALVWLAARDLGAAIMGAMALMIAMRIGAEYHFFDWWKVFQGYLMSPGILAGHASAVVGGMTVATLFRPNSPVTAPRWRIAWVLVFAGGFALAATFLRPIISSINNATQPSGEVVATLITMGIHKNSATPAWVLYCLAIASVVYAFLYWLIDVKKIDRGMTVLELAGGNTLLMYMLPFIMYSALTALHIDFLQAHFAEGWIGVARSAVLALGFVSLTALLTRCRVRLQL